MPEEIKQIKKKKRLEGYVAQGTSIVAQDSEDVRDTFAGDTFKPGEYQKLIGDSTAEEIEEESLLIDGVQFCCPTTPEDEAGNVLGPKK